MYVKTRENYICIKIYGQSTQYETRKLLKVSYLIFGS